MSVYRNTCGPFTVELSDPSPMWVTITTEEGELPGHIRSRDLYDLRYLIDRAIAAGEEREKGHGR